MTEPASALSVRVATIDDAEELARLGRQTFEDTFGPDNDAADMREYVERAFSLERTREELTDRRSTFFLANAGDRTVGYARLMRNTGHASVPGARPVELQRIYVDATAQGTGVGAQLMDTVINVARGEGYTTLWLGVWEHNPKAREFYLRWGFEDCGSQVFQLGSSKQTDLVMALAVS